MLIQILLLGLGLAILVKGANWLVDSATALAKRSKVSDLAIGLTIVAFGTSAPELVVNVMSSINNHQDLVFGNVIGSNNFNLFLILGIAGLITPLAVQSTTVWKEIPMSLGAVIVLFLFVNCGFGSTTPYLTRLEGGLLILLFSAFLFYVYRQLRSIQPEHSTAISEQSERRLSLPKIWLFIVLGLSGLLFGGHLVVTYAVKIAGSLGMSEQMIGLTIVAAGTSLPELATSVVAAFKKNADIAVGNIIGSNIFNILLILGISSIIKPIEYDLSFNRDLYFLAGGTALLFLAMFTGVRKKLDRWEALILLCLYLVYTISMIIKNV